MLTSMHTGQFDQEWWLCGHRQSEHQWPIYLLYSQSVTAYVCVELCQECKHSIEMTNQMRMLYWWFIGNNFYGFSYLQFVWIKDYKCV